MKRYKYIAFNEDFKVNVDVPENITYKVEIMLSNMWVKHTSKIINKELGYDCRLCRITYTCNLSTASEIHKKIKEIGQ